LNNGFSSTKFYGIWENQNLKNLQIDEDYNFMKEPVKQKHSRQ
jgi:hypothetical protein